MQFVDVLIRQAHSGGDVQTYENFEQKFSDGERYKHDDNIEFPVLVDDLEGTTHQVYGGLADPTYLIDRDGRVSFYCLWTHAPTLFEAIEELRSQDGRGVVKGDGIHRTPHLAASMTDGWKGLRRGFPRSLIELELSAPGVGIGTWLGYQIRPLLAPLTLRGKPLPTSAKIGLAIGAGALVALGWRAFTKGKNGR